MDDHRLSKLPAGAIGAVLGAVFATRLAALDGRSPSAGLLDCSTVSVCLGRIAPGAVVCGGRATMYGFAVGTTRAVVSAPVVSLGEAAARALAGALAGA